MAVPQAVALSGVYTLSPGVANLQDNLPASSYPYCIAWAIDRTPDAGYMVSNGTAWTSNAGPAGTNGNTILSGTGSPGGGLGVDGDFYVDVAASRMYGPKTAGVWGSGVSLVGATGSAGAAGPTGPAGLGAVTPSTPARVLGTAFQPNATKAVLCSYSIAQSVTNPLLAGASTSLVTLLSDTANPPTTERCRVAMSSSVALAVAVAITQQQTASVSYLVPPGHYVKLVATTSGTASNSIASETEEAMG